VGDVRMTNVRGQSGEWTIREWGEMRLTHGISRVITQKAGDPCSRRRRHPAHRGYRRPAARREEVTLVGESASEENVHDSSMGVVLIGGASLDHGLAELAVVERLSAAGSLTCSSVSWPC
jgi:hypothetical protein